VTIENWSDLNVFIDSMTLPILIVNSSWVIKMVNKDCSELLQKPCLNKPIIEIFPVLEDEFNNFHNQKLPRSIPKVSLLKDHPNKYWDVNISPLKLPDFEGAVLHLNDITDKINFQNLIMKNDKLASLGLLLAGIAHEINNPTNFVSGNIEPLKKDLSDLILILNKYSELSPNSDITAKLKEIDDFKNEVDVEYILPEIKSLLEGIKEGAIRIATLVKDLRSFARPDDKLVKITDIHELIDSTLSLLTHSLKGRVEVVREYGEIPDIECIPGKINQVLMNLLQNASQAIEGNGTIIIKTELVNHSVKISIKDSGAGISEENKKNLFKPFFTTKEPSVGTGLGLTISQSIIQVHGGTIQFDSKLGEGTEFVICLPYKTM